MKLAVTIFIAVVLFFIASCSNDVRNTKDLDENMLDMRVYHDNLGMYLRTNNADYALWLLDGMDSSLQVIASKFTTHRKLIDPFKKSYDKLLAPPIKDIRTSLQQNNFPKAIDAYRVLTKNCNNCHIDLEVEKRCWIGRRRNESYSF